VRSTGIGASCLWLIRRPTVDRAVTMFGYNWAGAKGREPAGRGAGGHAVGLRQGGCAHLGSRAAPVCAEKELKAESPGGTAGWVASTVPQTAP
jgi:hypothetical protein